MTIYTERPWTKLYSQELPTDITPDYPTMLDMFNASVTRAPDSAAIKYFDGVLTMAGLDARSDALAVALAGTGFGAGTGSRSTYRTTRRSSSRCWPPGRPAVRPW